MPSTERTRSAFRTGDWTVEPSRNLLQRSDEQVRLEPQVMDVLVHLADRAPDVVSKEDLIATVWEGRFVSDDVLTVAVYGLRKALGDDARQPRYVETVARRGYRWIAPVTPVDRAAPSVSRRWDWRIAAAMIVLAVTAAATWFLTSSPGRRHVASAEAHAAYLKGRFFLDQRSIDGCRQALQQFERAVALDPQDPAAHAGLSETYAGMSDLGIASPAEMRPRAMQAAMRALELDPESAEGHAALGRARFLFDWDVTAAARHLERAVAQNPDYMPAHQARAWLESSRGRHAEAAAAAERALQLDPVNTARYNELAWVLALDGRYDDALDQIERAQRLNPRAIETHLMKDWLHELAGRPDDAFVAYREALRISGAPETALHRIETLFRTEGLRSVYRDWLERQQTSGRLPLSETWRAKLLLRAGEPDRALAALEQAFRNREGALAWLNVDPNFEPLRGDARFRRIAALVGPR